MIEVNNLVKRYGNHTAVDHLSFKIEKGKIYGFLGPNGAGTVSYTHLQTFCMHYHLPSGKHLLRQASLQDLLIR